MGEAICREIWTKQVYAVFVWTAARSRYAQIHLELSICDKTNLPLPPGPSLLSCPVAALLSSERRLGKCRTSSAELSLHSCWCQLLCPPSSLVLCLALFLCLSDPLTSLCFLRKGSCCHLLAYVGNIYLMFLIHHQS